MTRADIIAALASCDAPDFDLFGYSPHEHATYARPGRSGGVLSIDTPRIERERTSTPVGSRDAIAYHVGEWLAADPSLTARTGSIVPDSIRAGLFDARSADRHPTIDLAAADGSIMLRAWSEKCGVRHG